MNNVDYEKKSLPRMTLMRYSFIYILADFPVLLLDQPNNYEFWPVINRMVY